MFILRAGKSHCVLGTTNLKEGNRKKGVSPEAQSSLLSLGTMNLKEPKKKKRVRLQAQPPLPISTNETGEWRIYTAHLSASGTCIVDPGEMEAVYSMASEKACSTLEFRKRQKKCN